jgi:hypothetical protein
MGDHAVSENKLELYPHAADAAVGEIAIQKTRCRGAAYDLLGHLSELRMIESVLSFPANSANRTLPRFSSVFVGLLDWRRIQVPATECPRILPANLARDRATMGDRWFAQEYMCEKVKADQLLRCAVRGTQP